VLTRQNVGSAPSPPAYEQPDKAMTLRKRNAKKFCENHEPVGEPHELAASLRDDIPASRRGEADVATVGVGSDVASPSNLAGDSYTSCE
jgi:hypothetical protein